ncbi:MAG: DUF6035 family protein, partial [Bacteroidales bacterium]|nr:DUF6035 family protein [Bacteroidales bacterium]
KANQIMDFLSDFRKNDLLNSVNQLVIIQQSSEIEKQILNDILKLNTYSNQGKNIIQVLLSKKAHYNLIIFLLKSKNIYLPLNTKLSDVETTFISCLKSSYFQDKIVQLLFSRGYHLCERDFEFIKQNYCQLEQKKMLFTFQNYEKLEQFSYIEKFYDHLNEFLVIESAKNGRLSILGNEKQSLLWMANLAAKEYSEHWMYFDFAFKHYGLYPALMNDDKKGTFRSKLKSLSDSSQEKDTRFESVLSVLYPELM